MAGLKCRWIISFYSVNFVLNSVAGGLVFGALETSLKADTVATTLINGAGATFPFPLYSKWFFEYQKENPEVQINYQSIGSGGGIRQFLQETVDFGATDLPMSDAQLTKSKKSVLHIPTVLGATVITYNLPNASKESTPSALKLSPDVVADIFLGTLSNWNDSRIKKLNPTISFPSDLSIIVARRSDGSGTTAIFTDYLSKISSEWKQKVGMGTSVNWPAGLGGKGNEGVSGIIKHTPGAIGYIELTYAESTHLPYASIQNKAGNFVLPNLKSVTAAAEAFSNQLPDDFRLSITNPDGPNAYPISAFTYFLVYQTLQSTKGEKIVKFLKWAVTHGQKYAEKLYYAPLPPSLVRKVEAKIGKINIQP
ncbi:MAG: phosphate ABC transporter substrate-binding protein PstS [Bdellovibrionia bacterium]